tara:strand:+ start:424 stop:801 length:378 start_codon:yes stop_codon:yes gene_type:complete
MIGTCSKCDGKGRIEAFSHVQGGVCFWCDGTGKLEVRSYNKKTVKVDAPDFIDVGDFRLTAGEKGRVYVTRLDELGVRNLDQANGGMLWSYSEGPEFSDGLNYLTQAQKMELAWAARNRWGTYNA